jgi:transposase
LFAEGLLLCESVGVADEVRYGRRKAGGSRGQLLRSRTRPKNEIHPVLIRNLKGKPPMSDLFGKAGRAWVADLELPIDERDAVNAGLRQVDFISGEIGRSRSTGAARPTVRRLMSVPGVNVITATTFTSAIGDVRRIRSPGRLVGYLGLDPKVRQSGSEPAPTAVSARPAPAQCATPSPKRRC